MFVHTLDRLSILGLLVALRVAWCLFTLLTGLVFTVRLLWGNGTMPKDVRLALLTGLALSTASL